MSAIIFCAIISFNVLYIVSWSSQNALPELLRREKVVKRMLL